MKITSKTMTNEQAEIAASFIGYKTMEDATKQELAFYYNQFKNGLSLGDADAYANLNTIMGYDVGRDAFIALDTVLWEQYNISLIEISGTKEDKCIIGLASKNAGLNLDFSKWRNLYNKKYSYEYFE